MLQRIRDGRTDLVFDYVLQSDGGASHKVDGVPLIRWCAYHGDVSAVRFLLEHGESLASLGPNLDLNGAAFHGHWPLCQFLLESGADANHQLPDTGETALHAALCKANRPRHDYVVEVLLDHGANPGLATTPGVETGAFMRDCRTKGETPLHRAAAFGSERAVELLLEAGAERDVKDVNGESPLSWASWHLRPPSILRLLCYDGFSVHPNNSSSYDHGAGWGQAFGKPHFER